MCCSKAALVGGICFTFMFLVTSFLRALSMSVHVLVLSYSKMTNLSILCMTSSCMLLGARDDVNKVSVSYGSTSQCSQCCKPVSCPLGYVHRMEVDLVHNTLGYLWAVIITKNERTDTIVLPYR